MPIRWSTLSAVVVVAVLGASIAIPGHPVGLVSPPGWLTSARAADRTYRLGFLGPEGREDIEKPFWQGLRDLGWIEGQKLTIDRRRSAGGVQRYPELAAELVGLDPDLLVSITTPATAAVMKATATIPIVFIDVGDPVASGFVTSLARPGGNVTGISSLNTELAGKRLELLRAAVPGLSRVAAVACCYGTALDGILERFLDDTAAAGRSMNIAMQPIRLRNYEDLDGLFASIKSHRANGVIFLPSGQMSLNRQRVAERALAHRLPIMGDDQTLAEAGFLVAYGIDRAEIYRRAVSLVDRVLKGARPADIPVEQPTKFRLVVNAKTATVLGLTIPPPFLLRADQVIE